MDETLLEDLLHINLSGLFKSYDSTKPITHHPSDKYEPCLEQISWIKTTIHGGAFDIPKCLLDCHLATLDHYLREQLLGFIWAERLPEIFALVDKIELTFNSSFYPHAVICPWQHAGLLFGLKAWEFEENPSAHRFLLAILNDDETDTRQFYLDFLHDQERAGEFHINQEVYARVALHCIKYICGEPHDSNFYYLEDEDYESDSEASHKYKTCQLALVALPSILSSAAPLLELAASLRAGMSAHWTEIYVARAEYLKRYEEWEKQQSQLDWEVKENPRAAKRPRGLIESLQTQSLTCEPMQGKEQQGLTTRREASTARARRGSAAPSGTSGGEVLL